MVSPHDDLVVILKILGTLTKSIWDGVNFQIVIGDRLGSLSFLKFFGVFEILEYPFPSEHFQRSICNGGFSSVVGCKL